MATKFITTRQMDREKKVELVNSLLDLGASMAEVIIQTDLPETTVRQIYERWSKTKKLEAEAATLVFAPPKQHSHEKVIIKGKRYIDVTDYFA